MADKKDLVFRLSLKDERGKAAQFKFNADGLRSLIANLISMAAQIPQEPSLQTKIMLDPDPPRATAFGISPIEDNPVAARVSIVAGPVDVQFAVPLDDLYEALKALDEATEPDPMSSRRLS